MRVLGNKDLLHTSTAVILNSSQSKTPCGDDSWVRHTAEAVPQITSIGYTLITSLGLITWELATHLAARNGGCQIIVCVLPETADAESLFERTIIDFDIPRDTAVMVVMETERTGRSPKLYWPARDRAAVALAQKIFPVSLRPGGRLATLTKSGEVENKIDRTFQIDYCHPSFKRAQYDITRSALSSSNWDYIVHWTRTRHGPWPGERRIDFYNRLLSSGSNYPNDAFSTLCRIADEGRIRASAEKIRDSVPAIGFTECDPAASLAMMRWLPKRVNWNFEPYGVAIKTEAARRIGIRPVIYGTGHEYENLPDSEKQYFQSSGEKNDVDWSREREWRHIGDLDLRRLPVEDLLFIAWRKSEAEMLREMTRCPAKVFTED